ncbi:MAG: CoA-binding protein [Ignavibacteria bacterium]
MNSKKLVDEFIAHKNIAVAGVSRNSKKFGNVIYRELKKKGFNVIPINPHSDEVEGDKCYPNLDEVTENVDAVLINLPPQNVLEVIRDVHASGIKKVWLQRGSQSEEAVMYCKENDIDCVSNECILMFVEPAAFIHKFHRWIVGVAGKLPE